MKVAYVIVLIAFLVIGLLLGRLLFTPNTSPENVEVVMQDLTTLTLSIDTQQGPLETYPDLLFEQNETIGDILNRLDTETIISASVEDGTIVIQGLADTPGVRFWRVYVDGKLAPGQFDYQPRDEAYIELQYESVTE